MIGVHRGRGSRVIPPAETPGGAIASPSPIPDNGPMTAMRAATNKSDNSVAIHSLIFALFEFAAIVGDGGACMELGRLVAGQSDR